MTEKIVFCDKCRDKMISDAEIHLIIFDVPMAGLGGILGGNKQKFRLCKKCFIQIRDSTEKWIMKN